MPYVTCWYSSFAYSRLRLISALLGADMSLRTCFQITDNEWPCLQHLIILRFKRGVFRTTILNIMGRGASETPWSASQKYWRRPLYQSILFSYFYSCVSWQSIFMTSVHDLYLMCYFLFVRHTKYGFESCICMYPPCISTIYVSMKQVKTCSHAVASCSVV